MDSTVRFCPACGARLAADLPTCATCGQPVGQPTQALAGGDQPTQPLAPAPPPARRAGAPLTWDYDIALLTNRDLLWDMLRVLVVAVVLVEGLVWAISFFFTDEAVLLPPIIWAIPLAVLVVLMALVMLVVYGNRFHGRFTLDEQGATYAVGGRERKILRIFTVLGVLFGGWRAVGPALLASSRQVERVEWRDVYQVHPDARRSVIALSNSWRTVLRLYCPPGRYAEILAQVQTYAAAGAAWRAAHLAPAIHRPAGFYLAWTGATVIATLAALAWPWTTYDGLDRFGLLAGIIVLLTGWAGAAWWSRLLALPAGALSLIFLVRLGLTALEPRVYPIIVGRTPRRI